MGTSMELNGTTKIFSKLYRPKLEKLCKKYIANALLI